MSNRTSGRGMVLGIAKETVFKTPVVPTVYLRHSGFQGGLKPSFIKSKSRYGNRASPVPVLDSSSGRQKVGFEVDPDNIGWFLKGLFGNETSALDSGATGAYKHTFTPQTGAVLPSWTLYLGYIINQVLGFGACLDSLGFTFSPRSIVEADAEFVYCGESAATMATPTYTTLRPWVFSQMGLTVDGITVADVVKVGLNLKNNLKDDDFRANDGGILSAISAGGFDVSGSLDAVWSSETKTLRDKILAGTSVPIVITLTGALIEVGKYNKLVITLPYCVFDSADIGDEEDGMTMSLPFNAGVGVNPIVTVDLINAKATIY